MDIRFEWDANKEEQNRQKHGISFETAKMVFADDNRYEVFDSGHSSIGEDRYITVGAVADRIITVVYTVRSGNVRIISARYAVTTEKRYYYGY